MRENGLGTSCARCNVASVKAQTNWTDLTTAQTQEDSSSDDSRKKPWDKFTGELTCQVQINVEIVSGRSRNSFTHRASSGTTPSISQDIPCWRKRDKATCKRALENSNPACPFCFLIATVNVLPPFLQCLHKNQNQKVQLSSTLASLGKFSTRQERLKNRYTRPAALPDVLISSAHDEAKNLPNLKPAESSIKTNDVQRDKKTVSIGTKDSHGKTSKCFHIKLRK